MNGLGVEPVQLLTQAFNFLLMVVILTKFLYRPIIKILDERKKKIEEGINYYEKSKKELEEVNKKGEAIIFKSKEEARNIIEEGKKSAKVLADEIVDNAHLQASKILEKSEKELEGRRQEMEQQLRSKTVDLSLAIIKRLVGEDLSQEDHREIIERKIKELSKFS